MGLEVRWDEDLYAHKGKRNIFVARANVSPDYKQVGNCSMEYVESFCLPSCNVAVYMDAVPIKSALISVSSPALIPHDSRMKSRPSRVHYGFATNAAYEWGGRAFDAYFRESDTEPTTFTANFDLQSAQNPVLGLSFVLQLEDGTWVKDYDKDFYVGGKRTKVPSCVEIPFSSPPGHKIIPGRMLSLYRMNHFWWQPQLDGQGLHTCMHETHFVLAEVEEGAEQQVISDGIGMQGKKASFAAFLMMVDVERETRASIFSVDGGNYGAVRIEDGRSFPIRRKSIEKSVVCVHATARSPYEATRLAVEYAAKKSDTFCSRLDKISSPRWRELGSCEIINTLGFCTWDAFGHTVSEKCVRKAIEWFRGNDIPIGYIIVDDGWQAGGGEGPKREYDANAAARTGRPTMSSYGANEKFSGSLRSLAKGADIPVVAWSAVIGYWGGTNGNACGVQTGLTKGLIARGLWANALDNPVRWEKWHEIVKPTSSNLNKFFHNYFVKSMASEQSVRGVKLDAQSILEIMCDLEQEHSSGALTRSSLTASYRRAISDMAQQAFPNMPVLNCMSCGPETIFYSGPRLTEANVCWRTSNDHAFPGVEEDADVVAWHVLCNAMNCILLGEIFPICDWDMFRAGDSWADIHAIARVISGGPVYISDTVPLPLSVSGHATRLLNALRMKSGKIPRCEYPGRPTVECLFHDPRMEPVKALKIYNRSAVLGLLALFNISSDKDRSVKDSFAPYEVEDFDRLPTQCEYVSFVTGAVSTAFHHRNRTHRCEITLPSMTAALAHICPVFQMSKRIRFATIGQPHLLNCGASVACINFSTVTGSSSLSHRAECHFHDPGEVYFWLDKHSSQNLAMITSFNGYRVIDTKIVECGTLQFLALEVPSVQPYSVTLHFADTG